MTNSNNFWRHRTHPTHIHTNIYIYIYTRYQHTHLRSDKLGLQADSSRRNGIRLYVLMTSCSPTRLLTGQHHLQCVLHIHIHTHKQIHIRKHTDGVQNWRKSEELTSVCASSTLVSASTCLVASCALVSLSSKYSVP
jgi:hypothetical protein